MVFDPADEPAVIVVVHLAALLPKPAIMRRETHHGHGIGKRLKRAAEFGRLNDLKTASQIET